MPLIERISGSLSSYSLKHRVFNIFLFSGTLIGILDWMTTSFFTLKTPVSLHAISVGFLLLCYYFSRVRKLFTPTFITLAALGIISVLSAALLLNSGSESKVLPAMVCSFTVFFVSTESRLTILVALMHVVGLILSVSLNFFYPEWAINHYTGSARFADTILFLIMLVALLFVVLNVIRDMVTSERRSLRNKDIYLNQQNLLIQDLLKELNHRVKNNLQVISALLSLQAYRAQNPEAALALNEGRSRLESMALLHKKLYQDNFFNQIALAEYIDDLVVHVLGDYNVCVKRSVEDIMLTADQAIPLGLILNEIFTNIKKRLSDQDPDSTILIKTKIDSKNVRICIKDNSQHNIQQFFETEQPNVGKELIEMLVSQLDGNCKIKLNKQGELEIRIKFKLKY
jgi:two-component sensor histidine kinase